MNPRRLLRGIPIPLVLGCVLFMLVLGYIVGASLVRRDTATFTERSPQPGGLTLGSADTVTVDTGDPEQWRYVDLDQGRLLAPPDTSAWDLALRRYQIRVRGAMARLEDRSLDNNSAEVLLEDHGQLAIGKWYRYSMLSHLLEPKGGGYFIRTDEDRVAKLEILSYYCPGLTAGCLTFSYAPAAAMP